MTIPLSLVTSSGIFDQYPSCSYANHTLLSRQYLIIQINIFTLMAEAAMKAGDLDNAEKLYKEVC